MNKIFKHTPGFDWFWPQMEDGSWEPHTFATFDKYLNADSVYMDIGAWIGPTVLYASQIAKSVIAFEPDPVAFKALVENMNLNEVKNVAALDMAVWRADEMIRLGRRNGFGDSMSSVRWTDETIPVRGISINNVIENMQPSFIKMDIEGGEAYVLSHAKEMLEKHKPTLYLSLHTPWFEDKASYMDSICSALEIYPNLYDQNGDKITIEDLKITNEFNSVVATYD